MSTGNISFLARKLSILPISPVSEFTIENLGPSSHEAGFISATVPFSDQSKKGVRNKVGDLFI
jgi:hypothetical protein